MNKDVDKELKEAIEELERITADPETRELYYQREKDLRDKISLANQERKKGIEQGIEQNKKKIVLSMYKKHIEIETICEIVELSKEEVEKIIKEN